MCVHIEPYMPAPVCKEMVRLVCFMFRVNKWPVGERRILFLPVKQPDIGGQPHGLVGADDDIIVRFIFFFYTLQRIIDQHPVHIFIYPAELFAYPYIVWCIDNEIINELFFVTRILKKRRYRVQTWQYNVHPVI